MRIVALSVLFVLGVGIETARAEDAPAPAAGPTVEAGEHRIALATNLPFRWKDAGSVAVSLYVSVFDRHAIRANFASYKDTGHLSDIIGLFAGGDGVDHHGRVTDVGVAWVYYPRRVWDGLMLEAGVLRRARNVSTYDPDRTFEYVDRDTTVYAGRGLVGWSWLIYERAFLALGAGVSVGHERGGELSHNDYPRMMSHSAVSRVDVTGEAYLRIGFAFGL